MNEMTSLRPSPVDAFKKLLTPLLFAAAVPAAQASTDYGPAMWLQACAGHWYTSGYGKKVYVIHDIEGYYQSMIWNVHNCNNSISVHYAVNGKKDTQFNDPYPAGDVAQLVRDAYYGWHARCWNKYSMGTEHEGFASNPAWFTEALYVSSASLTKSKCNKYGIPKDRNHVIAHGQKSVNGWGSWANNNLPAAFDPFCNDHTDPGPYWDWRHYMDLVQGINSPPSRPTSLNVKPVTWQRLDLRWADNSFNEDGFLIQRSANSNTGPWSNIRTNNANDRDFAVTGLAANTKYWFRVRAFNNQGNSDWSGVTAGTTLDRYPPNAPSGLTAVANNDDKITLTWTDNSNNEDQFNINQSSDGTTWALIKETNPNVTSFQVTGLRGNRTYYFRVKALNTAGSSTWSAPASDTTPPSAPTGLVANPGAGFNRINLAWTDTAGAEVGFKIERATAVGGPFTQIATNAASDATYSDIGLAATTTYYYRVRSYNANGNSLYSNTDSATTGNAPPVMAAIGNKTVAAGSPLTFMVTSTDPNKTVTTSWNLGFEPYAHNTADGTVLFRTPTHNGTTSAFIDTTVTNWAKVVTNGPTGSGSSRVLKAVVNFKTGTTNPELRLSTMNTANEPNPAINLGEMVSFKVHSTKTIRLGMGARETFNNVVNGNDGGTAGEIEWVGITNVTATGSPQPIREIPANTWTTVYFNIPFEPCIPQTAGANGLVDTWSHPTNGVKGTLQHLAIVPTGTMGAYTICFDDFVCIVTNRLVYSLDAGAPAGALIQPKSGIFQWTPTTGQVGTHNITVRVVDQLGEMDFETIKVTVTGTGNAAPVLGAIGNKTILEGTALTFTATATDPDAGQTKTFSLDSGNPSGSSINASSGAFAWTPSEAQGPGTYPITVRVTDNGSPVSNDFETITVTVTETNSAPVMASIANQTVNEGSTFNLTPSSTDSDLPANTLTYSLSQAPLGMTINSSSGAISWPTAEKDGPDVAQVIVRVADNGLPAKSHERTFNVTVNEVNVAPILTVSNAISTTVVLTDFENYADGSYNGTILFRQPSFSGSTSSHLDTAQVNETTVSTNSPGTESSSVLQASFTFKTGQVNQWLRLTTAMNASQMYSLPNPTIDLGKHLKFDVYTDKSIKICVGVRETGTSAPLGANGGMSGAIEWIGATGKSGTAPICTRTIPANTWTTLDFDIPNDASYGFTGDGAIAPGKGTIEHIAIVPNGGTGAYNVYVDNFKVYSSSTNLTVSTGDEITLQCSATDADLPGQSLAFSLDAGAPAGAEINDESGEFSWIPTPAQSPSTNIIAIRVTDNGSPNLSSVQNVTIKVVKVNTPPSLELPGDFTLEQNSGQSITFTAAASDDDIPANTVTYSLIAPPSGATINSSSGVFNWSPPTASLSTNIITVRVTDNGVPPLYMEQQFTVNVVPVNTAPSLSLGTGRVSETIAHYETFANNTADGAVMFRKPTLATQTSGFIDAAAANHTKITNSIPAGNPNVGARALVARWNFKTGMSDYWVRLTTTNAVSVPNPTIDLGARVRFDIHSSKAVKVGLGVRETGTSAEIGANGGTTGGIEWIGVTNKVGNNPVPNRLVPANTWTTLEFNLPSEPCTNFSGGNSVLATGKGVLEHLAIRGEGGTGTYTVYVDNFQVVSTTALPATLSMKSGSTLTFTASASDPNPGAGLTYALDPDFGDTHTNAVINDTTGAFSWTPGAADVGTTNAITVSVDDEPTNGGVAKSDSETVTVIVTADAVAPQAAESGSFVAGGDAIQMNWVSVPGLSYAIQYREKGASGWNDASTITATNEETALEISNDGGDRYYRVVEATGGSSE